MNTVRFFGNTLSATYKTVGSGLTSSNVYDRLEVADPQGKVIRSIEFFTSLYNEYTSLAKLDSVRISAPGAERKVYKFHYQNSSRVPSIYTVGIDHWGFCNSSDTPDKGVHTVPTFRHLQNMPLGNGNNGDAFITHSGNTREPNAEWAQAGVFDQITDPQGVKTSLRKSLHREC